MKKKELSDAYPEHAMKEAIAKQYAIYKFQNMPKTSIREKMGLSPEKMNLLDSSIEVEYYIKQLSSDLMKNFKTKLINEVTKLVPLVVNVLNFHLEQKNLNAVPHVLKIMGFDKEEEAQTQSITVYMPGQSAPATLNVTPEKDKSPVITIDEIQNPKD